MADFPLTGQIMAPLGFALLFLGMKESLKSRHLLAVSAIAASFKLLDCVLFSLPVTHLYIINPAQAIIMQGVAFTAAVKLWKKVLPISATAAPASILLFNLISYLIFGAEFTPILQNAFGTIMLHIPAAILSTSLLLWFMEGRSLNVSRLPVSWRLAASAASILLAIVIRGILA